MVNTKFEKKVLLIELDRPERGNSLDPSTLLKLRSIFLETQSNDKIRAIILTGTGEKDFCTGIDTKIAAKFSTENIKNIANLAGDIATLIYFGKPTIVAINGRLMGMGVVFSTAADFRLIVPNAVMQMPEINFGIFPGASCIVQMQRVCGPTWTKRILLSGDKFTAEDCIMANIADELCDFGQIQEKAWKIAKNIAKKNPILVKTIKMTTMHSNSLSYNDGINLESDFSRYFAWKYPEEQLKQIKEEYGLSYKLLGNPELLIKEINNISDE